MAMIIFGQSKLRIKKPTSSHYCSGTGPMVNTCLTFFMENFEDLQHMQAGYGYMPSDWNRMFIS